MEKRYGGFKCQKCDYFLKQKEITLAFFMERYYYYSVQVLQKILCKIINKNE